MEDKKINIGIMGCASIARRSMIPAILELPEIFKLVAVASRDHEKAEEFGREFGCEAVVGYDNLINREDIDALYVPLPTGLHQEWISKSISKGKHVYAEKTFASDINQAKELVRAGRMKQLALMEGYMFLYHRQQITVKSMVENGDIGQIRHYSGAFGFPPLPSTNFRYDPIMGGGVVMDAAGYPLRAAHYICGTELKVKAASLYRERLSNCPLWGSAYLSNKEGLGASIAFGFDNSYRCEYEIWGSLGSIRLNRAYTAGPSFSAQIVKTVNGVSEVIDIGMDNHFKNAMLHFAFAIRNQNERESLYHDIIIQSSALDQIIRLSDL